MSDEKEQITELSSRSRRSLMRRAAEVHQGQRVAMVTLTYHDCEGRQPHGRDPDGGE